MDSKTEYPKLFEPASIGKIRLRNRVVMLPMGTAYATPSGEVTERTIDYYIERAKGGVGLITVGNISPHLPNVMNQLVLGSDWVLMGQYELVEKVHAHGTKIAAQLNHAGKQKYTESRLTGEELISSSAIPTTFLGEVYPSPKPLSKGEIYQMIEKYVKATERAKKVGYDIVELHGAHGYLLNQFMSPFMNKRTDEFGGSLENRMRFPLELIKAVRQTVGPEFPIGFRLSAEEFVPGGISLEESSIIAQMLEAAGVAYISVTVGIYDTAHKMIDLMPDPEGWKEFVWEAIKKTVKVPIIAGGGLRHPDFCERLLERRKADLIGLARPLVADPEWPIKAMAGRVEDIRLCISCNECMAGSARRRRGGGARYCAINAAMGREREFSQVPKAPAAKRVMVIGGGPGGMEAARVAALRGHQVTLYERESQLGGQLLMAGQPQSKRKVLWFRDYLVTQLNKLGVKLKLRVEVTQDLIEKAKPDAVVVATGAEPILLDIPGVPSNKVFSAWDLLKGKTKPEKGKVAVVGGGMVGCEVAEYLLETENKVTIIEQLPSIASDMEPFHRFVLLGLFKEQDVVMLTERKVLGMNSRGVLTVNLNNGQEELVEAEWVIIAIGAKSVNHLTEELNGKVPELYSVGDCNEPRVILEAVYEGCLVGSLI
jgi:2,4-dienoyl-CoA reductase-like NADH-dependent reductase (Old Yellow Enzyme family)/thioredoxin reductase